MEIGFLLQLFVLGCVSYYDFYSQFFVCEVLDVYFGCAELINYSRNMTRLSYHSEILLLLTVRF